MMQRKVTVDVEPTPNELAFEFAMMGNHEQADFFSELARLVEKWDKPFCFQLQALIDSPRLTEEGRELMQQIGEYGEVSHNARVQRAERSEGPLQHDVSRQHGEQ